MNDRVAHAMQRSQITKQRLLLCCIDVDQQIALHDIYGDEGIRELLRQVSERIQCVLRPADSLGQLHNRTLALLIEEMNDWQDVDPILQKILACFVEPVTIDEQPQSITGSIGVAEFDGESNVETTELFEQAEFACYRARRNRSQSSRDEQVSVGPGYAFFGGHLLARHSVQKMLSRSIEEGFARNELQAYLQPVFQLQTPQGSPVCYALESLMRWQHPQAGIILPEMLLRLLEENRLTKIVGGRMLLLAAHTWHQLLHSGKISANVKLSINIHPDQVHHPDFVASIQQLYSTFGIADQQLILEFKGKTLMQINGISIHPQLQQLQQMGVLICVDNFGDIDAPLLCLQQFPLDMIKLAHGMVSDIETCSRQLVLIEHMQQLCTQLNMQMIVQGVDSADKAHKLQQIGCKLLQGNHLGVPTAASELKVLC